MLTSIPFVYFRPAVGAALFGRNTLGFRHYDQGAVRREGSDDLSFKLKYHKGTSSNTTWPCPCCIPPVACGSIANIPQTIRLTLTPPAGTPLPGVTLGAATYSTVGGGRWTFTAPADPMYPNLRQAALLCNGGGSNFGIQFVDMVEGTTRTFFSPTVTTLTTGNLLAWMNWTTPTSGTSWPVAWRGKTYKFEFFRT